MNSDITRLINDVEINFLADLFLARYGFDTTAKCYRRFKNTLIILSHDFSDTETELKAVASLDGLTASALISDLENTVAALPRPMHETFNKYYGAKIHDSDDAHITMPDDLSVMESIKFLAAVFLTIIICNYPKYEYFEYH